MSFFDLSHPWLKPRRVRGTIVAVCLGWAGVEWFTGSPGWAILFATAGAYCAYDFFLRAGSQKDSSPQDHDD